jgi:DNA-binding IclR family transcriptional regulator
VSTNEAYFASRAMQALEVLAFGPLAATQLAAELQVHPRTARRLLNRMVHDGWLVRREGPRPTYTPTMRIVALAAQLAQRAPLVRHALDLADGLYDGPGDAVHLAVPSYRSALRLVRATPSADGVPAARDLAPANAIAAGKLLLAFRDPWREAVLASPLEPVTERTLIEPAALLADLERARERGYALEDEEFRAGLHALAVPVEGDDGEVVAALALSSAGGTIEALLERAGDVVATGAEISARLQQEAAA